MDVSTAKATTVSGAREQAEICLRVSIRVQYWIDREIDRYIANHLVHSYWSQLDSDGSVALQMMQNPGYRQIDLWTRRFVYHWQVLSCGMICCVGGITIRDRYSSPRSKAQLAYQLIPIVAPRYRACKSPNKMKSSHLDTGIDEKTRNLSTAHVSAQAWNANNQAIPPTCSPIHYAHIFIHSLAQSGHPSAHFRANSSWLPPAMS